MPKTLPMSPLIWAIATSIQVHDEPMPGSWLCGHCPYSNVGVICTKCGSYRYDGTELVRSVAM